ncbi:hypothetical protein BST61_g10972 [Cercospora zeina]
MARNVLITGGNRGLGRGLVEAYLNKPDTHVFATVRNPSDSTSEPLASLPKGENSSLTVLKLEAGNAEDYPALAKSLTQDHNINELHLVIANAGIANVVNPVVQASVSDFLSHFQINAMGPLLLFQSLRPFLHQGAKFVPISSKGASFAFLEEFNVPNVEYGTSKAALNFITQKIHYENEDLVIFPMDPAWVTTDMGLAGAQAFGLKEENIGELLITTQESVDGMVEVIEGATREKSGGKFMRYNGEVTEW